MYTNLQRWGNSSAVRLPKKLLESAHIKENDPVELVAENNIIFIRPVRKSPASLDELFAGYTGDYVCTEADFGPAAGNEVW